MDTCRCAPTSPRNSKPQLTQDDMCIQIEVVVKFLMFVDAQIQILLLPFSSLNMFIDGPILVNKS